MGIFITSRYHSVADQVHTPSELARKLRRADEFIRLAVVAATETLGSAIEKNTVEADGCGLILGSSFGTMQTNFEVLDFVVSGEQSSPTLFSHSVFNAAAGYLASTFDMRGGALTVTDFCFPFFRALQEGILALNSGWLKRCLILQVETYSHLLQDARRKKLPEEPDWQPGVICWLLEKEDNQDGADTAGYHLDSLRIEDQGHDSNMYLEFSERVVVNDRVHTVTNPLGSPFFIDSILQDFDDGHRVDCRVNGQWGEVRLQLSGKKPGRQIR